MTDDALAGDAVIGMVLLRARRRSAMSRARADLPGRLRGPDRRAPAPRRRPLPLACSTASAASASRASSSRARSTERSKSSCFTTRRSPHCHRAFSARSKPRAQQLAARACSSSFGSPSPEQRRGAARAHARARSAAAHERDRVRTRRSDRSRSRACSRAPIRSRAPSSCCACSSSGSPKRGFPRARRRSTDISRNIAIGRDIWRESVESRETPLRVTSLCERSCAWRCEEAATARIRLAVARATANLALSDRRGSPARTRAVRARVGPRRKPDPGNSGFAVPARSVGESRSAQAVRVR